jgi:hypothetical protein
MVGGWFGGAVTWMLKVGRDALAVPSLTLIAMLPNVPTSLVDGLPVSCPVEALKVAQAGKWLIENVRRSPSASDAAGWKEY